VVDDPTTQRANPHVNRKIPARQALNSHGMSADNQPMVRGRRWSDASPAAVGRAQGDRGVAVVEFALVLPVLMILILGMLTGGICLSRALALSSAAREGTRFGATYPTTGGLNAWLDSVAARAVTEANGDLDSTVTSRTICVAYVSPGSGATDQTKKRTQTGNGAASYTTGSTCFDDGRPSSERRVQVVVTRTSVLDTFVKQTTLNLSAKSVARFEVSVS
jgi:Flp pilus assembly protein TadG